MFSLCVQHLFTYFMCACRRGGGPGSNSLVTIIIIIYTCRCFHLKKVHQGNLPSSRRRTLPTRQALTRPPPRHRPPWVACNTVARGSDQRKQHMFRRNVGNKRTSELLSTVPWTHMLRTVRKAVNCTVVSVVWHGVSSSAFTLYLFVSMFLIDYFLSYSISLAASGIKRLDKLNPINWLYTRNQFSGQFQLMDQRPESICRIIPIHWQSQKSIV